MDLLVNLFTILLGIILIIYAYFKYVYTYFEKRHIPFLEPTFPFGNYQALIFQKKSFAETLQSLYTQMENYPAFGTFMLSQPILMLRDPEMVKQCLVKHFSSIHDRQNPINEQATPLFGHLFFMTGQKWKNLRSKLSPAFTSGKMKLMFSTFHSITENFIDHLKTNGGRNLNVEDTWAKLTTDIIASCAFGIECNSMQNPNNEFRHWGIRSLETPLKLKLGMIFSNGGKYVSPLARWPLLDTDISDYFIKMVKDTMEYREKNNIQRKDFLQMLIDLKNNKKIEMESDEVDQNTILDQDDGKSLTVIQCAAQAYVFFLGGFGTSSSTLTFAAYELAQNQEIQKRLQNEIDQVIEEHQDFTYESINKMVYLEQVIKETLRKYPPLPFLNRMVTKTVDIPWDDQGQTIQLEKDVKIMIPVYAIHHDAKNFTHPEYFNPDRFSEENKHSFSPYAYIPFGEGPHNCIGSRFGLMQTKMGLAMLLRNFNIEMCEKTKTNLKLDRKKPMLAFEEPLFLSFVKRN